MQDWLKMVIIGLGICGIVALRYYCSTSPMEPQAERLIEQFIEVETGVDILPSVKSI